MGYFKSFLSVFFVCCLFTVLCGAGNPLVLPADLPDDENIKADTIINDTVYMNIDTVPPVCIDQKVLLSCDPKYDPRDVLEYEWIDESIGKVISKDRNVEVMPKVTTTYRLNIKFIKSSEEAIKNGDFEAPFDPKNPYFQTVYRYATGENNMALINPGTYKLSDNPRRYHVQAFDNLSDHTTGTGKMLVVNGDTGRNKLVWGQTIRGLKPGTQYAFSACGAGVSAGTVAILQYTINDSILGANNEALKPPRYKWTPYFQIWTANADTARISLVDQTTAGGGNDFAVDDISFAPVVLGIGRVEVKVLPQIDMEALGNAEVCENGTVRVLANATGSGTLLYEWSRNGVELSSLPHLEITNTQLLDAGIYSCMVSGTCGSRTEKFELKVNPLLRIQGVIKDTVSVCLNGPVRLDATDRVTGHKMTYKWSGPRKNGWLPVNADEAAYYKNAVAKGDEGIYTCDVKSACGDGQIQSVLRLDEALKILKAPNDTVICAGSSLKLTVRTNSSYATTTWRFTDGTVFTGDTLVLTNATQSGTWWYEVGNACLATVQGAVNVAIPRALTDLVLSRDTAVCDGGMARLKAVIRGDGLKYLWTGPDGFSATTASVTITGVNARKEGVYSLTVTDICGNVKRGSVVLSVLREFDGLTVSKDTQVCLQVPVTFEVKGGAKTLKYEWTAPDGTITRTSKIRIEKVTDYQVGIYTCRIIGTCSTQTKKVILSLHPAMTARGNTGETRVCEGEEVVLQAIARGSALTYKWTKDGVMLGTTTSVLNLGGVNPSKTGVYTCLVGSACENRTLNYEINLKTPTRILSYTPDKFVNENETVRLFVNAEGESLTYEWLKNGVKVSESTNKLTIPDIGKAGEYIYVCRVKGDCGEKSVTIRVTVGKYKPVEKDMDVQLCEGGEYAYNVTLRPDGCPDDAALSYSWEFGGKVVSNNSVLNFSGLSAANQGVYTGKVTGQCGELTIRLNLTVLKAPKVEFPDKYVVCGGIRLSIIAKIEKSDKDLVTFEWRKEGVLLSCTDSILVLPEVYQPDNGIYTCKVIGSCGENSYKTELEVVRNLKVLDAPDTVFTCKGAPVQIEIQAIGPDDLTYSWDGPNKNKWNGEKTAIYSNTSVQRETDAGIYTCSLRSSCGSKEVKVKLDIEKELALLSESPDQTLCPGTDIEMYARMNLEALKYKWTRPNGTSTAAATLRLSKIQPSEAGTYYYQVNSRCSQVKGDIVLGVYKAMGDLVLSRDTTVCEHATVRFAASVTGDGLKYRWMGPARFTSAQSAITIADVAEGNAGQYDVSVTDVCKQERHGSVRLSMLREFDNLKITKDTTLCPGSGLLLEVKDGIPALSYEWIHPDGTVTTGAALTLGNIQPQQAGEYICRVKGTCTSQELKVRVSLFAGLEVGDHQALLRECIGNNGKLTVTASGEQLSYIWTKNGKEVGYRASELALNDIIPADAGFYQCRVLSVCGEQTLSYELQIKENTKIKSHTPDKFVSLKDPTELYVRTVGENNRFKWSKDGELLGENTSDLLYVPNVGDLVDTLHFVCVVTGDCGSDTARINIKVGDYRTVKEIIDPAVLCEESSYTYVADIVPTDCYGDEPFEYTWVYSKDTLAGTPKDTLGHESLLRLGELQVRDSGIYCCRVKGDCGEAVLYWTIKVQRLPHIDTITPDAFIIEGANHQIEVKAGGDDIICTWTKNGALFQKGAGLLLFNPTRYEDEGKYRMTVQNTCSTVSDVSNLRVWRKTTVISPEERDYDICMGADTSFTVEALGAPGLVYKWYRNDTLLSVPMIQMLTLKNVSVRDTGRYKCVVNGRGGEDSCYMNLKVIDLPELEIRGDFEVCVNPEDLVQEYEGISNEVRLEYRWEALLGKLNGNGNKTAEITWQGRDTGVVTLRATSLATRCYRKEAETMKFNMPPDIWFDMPPMVGYCIDSLPLNQAYPAGGYYLVDGQERTTVNFDWKDKVYRIDYYYTDVQTGCSSDAGGNVGIDIEPYIRLRDERLLTGVCRPVVLTVDEATDGKIEWNGKGMLDTADLKNPVYKPADADGEDILYDVKLTDPYDCTASDFVIVAVVPRPRVEITADTLVGECNDITLKGEYYSPCLQKMTWEPSASLNVIDNNHVEVTEKQVGVNRFYAVAADTFGCLGGDTVNVVVVAAPGSTDHEFCENFPVVVDCREDRNFIWSDGFTNPVRELNRGGDYTLTITDRFGCGGDAFYRVHPMPVTNLRDTLIFEGQSMEFVLDLHDIYGPYDVRWHDGTTGWKRQENTKGYYWVKITDNIGCSSSDTAYLDVKERYIYAPDAFLPESTGPNSRFYLKEINFVSQFEMYIYNRWGELVFKTNEIGFNGGWDGSFKGAKCLPGAYVWSAYSDGKPVGKGLIVLVR